MIMEKEIQITQEQKNKVDRFIELIEQLSELAKQYPKVYSLLHSQLMPLPTWDEEKRILLPRETLKYKAIAEMYVADEEKEILTKKNVKHLIKN